MNTCGRIKLQYNEYRKSGFRAWKGSEVSMILNTKTAELYLQQDDEEKVLVIRNIKVGNEISYKMAISMSRRPNSISLVRFKGYYSWDC